MMASRLPCRILPRRCRPPDRTCKKSLQVARSSSLPVCYTLARCPPAAPLITGCYPADKSGRDRRFGAAVVVHEHGRQADVAGDEFGEQGVTYVAADLDPLEFLTV